MSRHRTRPLSEEEESSSDDDSLRAFGCFAEKKQSSSDDGESKKRSNASAPQQEQQPAKRHYGASTTRKTKMDTVLEELQMEAQPASLERHHPHRSSASVVAGGSFVDPEHEYTTTNMFVGNLPLTINEAILSDFFSRFGSLHSVKIMWPRGVGDPKGSSHSVNGFVCFHERSAAENAVQHCKYHLCFGGRQLRTGWGKPILMQQHPSSSSQRPPTNSSNNNTDVELTPFELEEYRLIIQHDLLAPARQRICTAMAFCFDKSRAARHICRLLQTDMMTTRPVDTTVAYLYLLSDILYNSQQPGVRNAFVYRDAIHDMCPVVFAHWRTTDTLGRLSRDRLSHAVSAVLSAWTMWGVYDATFLDTLEDAYRGRREKPSTAATTPGRSQSDKASDTKTRSIDARGELSLVSNSGKSHNSSSKIEAGSAVAACPPPVTVANVDETKLSPGNKVGDDVDGQPLDDEDYYGIVDADPEDPLYAWLQQHRARRTDPSHLQQERGATPATAAAAATANVSVTSGDREVADEIVSGEVMGADEQAEGRLASIGNVDGDRRSGKLSNDHDDRPELPDVDDVDGQPLDDDDVIIDDNQLLASK